MTEILQPEERAALTERYAAEPPRARFPALSPMDPERQQALQAGFRHWQEQWIKDLSGLLRAPCSSQPARPHTLLRAPFARTEDERFLAYLDGQAQCPLVLSVPRSFAVSVCERLFGAPMAPRDERPLSPAEASLLRDLALDLLTSLGDCFGGVTFVPGDPPEGEAPGPVEAWLAVECPIRCNGVTGAVCAAFAQETAQRLVGAAPAVAEVAPTPETLRERLGDVPVELQAVLGTAKFSLIDLTALRVGDVITLDRHAEDLVDVCIEERRFFQARAGLAGQTIALEIVEGPQKREDV